MRSVWAMIVGGLVTLTGLYIHDVLATGTIPRAASASPEGAIVNWNVAVSELSILGENVQNALLGLKPGQTAPSQRSAALSK
jgi:hypothetical protein